MRAKLRGLLSLYSNLHTRSTHTALAAASWYQLAVSKVCSAPIYCAGCTLGLRVVAGPESVALQFDLSTPRFSGPALVNQVVIARHRVLLSNAVLSHCWEDAGCDHAPGHPERYNAAIRSYSLARALLLSMLPYTYKGQDHR